MANTTSAKFEKTHNDAAEARARQDLEDELSELKAEIGSLRDAMSKYGNVKVGQFRRDAETKFSDVAERAQAAEQNISDHAERIETQVEDYIRERPIASLAMAAGAGFLLAYLNRVK